MNRRLSVTIGCFAALGLIGLSVGGAPPAGVQEAGEPAPQRPTPSEAGSRAVRRVLHGVVTFDPGEHQAVARLEPPIDADRCLVILSDAIVRGDRDNGNPRNGAIVAELTDSRLVVWTDEQHTRRAVSYQVVEYE